MKRILALLCAGLLALSLVGCGGSDTVSTRPLERAFQSPEEAQKAELDRAVEAIKAGNFQEAASSLQRLAAMSPTESQQKAITDTLEQVQKRIAEELENRGIQLPGAGN